MHQHCRQHGRADTRVEEENKGSSIFGLPQHLHGRADGRAEDKNITRDCSVENQANTGPNTAVLKAVLNTLNSTTINSFQILKNQRAVILTKTEKSHYTKEKRETLGKVNERHQNKKIPRVKKIFILLEGSSTEVYKIYIRELSTSMRLSISFLFVSVSKTIMEE